MPGQPRSSRFSKGYPRASIETLMRWSQPPSGPGSTSRVQVAPFGVAVNSHSSANPLPLASALKSPFLTTDGPLAAPTGSPNLSNSGVEPDTPRFPSSRLAAEAVRPKVRRRLKYSGPWLKYHDARPASKFAFFERLSKSFHRDPDEMVPATFRPGQYLPGAGGAFWGCGELPFVGQSIAVGIGAEITIPYHRRPFGRAHRFAEPFQQRRRAGHAQIPQQPARRGSGAPEGASQVEVLHV